MKIIPWGLRGERSTTNILKQYREVLCDKVNSRAHPNCRTLSTNKYYTSENNRTFILYTMVCICQGDMFRPSRSSSGPPRKQIPKLFNNSWIFFFFGGPDDDLLGRNMSPWHIYHCILNETCVIDWRIVFVCMLQHIGMENLKKKTLPNLTFIFHRKLKPEIFQYTTSYSIVH